MIHYLFSALILHSGAGHTIGVDDGIDDADLDGSERRYQSAMSWLTTPAVPNSAQTRIDVYRDKQTAYTDAFERKVKAFDDALERAMKESPNNPRAAYDKWVSENHKTYNNHVQAAYMDWVTLGKKEEVEYYFAIVDNDSAMARVEASKVCGFVDTQYLPLSFLYSYILLSCLQEAMRNAIVSDPDGSTEYSKVSLTPSNWAWLAKQEADAGPRGETPESLTWKISRLEKINLLLKSMIAVRGPSSRPA